MCVAGRTRNAFAWGNEAEGGEEAQIATSIARILSSAGGGRIEAVVEVLHLRAVRVTHAVMHHEEAGLLATESSGSDTSHVYFSPARVRRTQDGRADRVSCIFESMSDTASVKLRACTAHVRTRWRDGDVREGQAH